MNFKVAPFLLNKIAFGYIELDLTDGENYFQSPKLIRKKLKGSTVL